MSQLRVSGYDDPVLLGFGSLGEVWQARRRATGETVVLRRLAGATKEALASAREQCAAVRSLASVHAVRVRTSTRSGPDDVLVLDHASGGSLAALVATRGVLAPGEVVTVLGPVAQVLAQAHAVGVLHGRVDVASVLLDAAGRPLLDGLGLRPLHDPADGLDPTGALGPAADVWAVGALGVRLLTGQAPGSAPLTELVPTAPVPLVRALEAALAFDPEQRPSAADLAEAVLASCPAVALTGTRPAVPAPVRVGPARWRVPAAAAVAVLALVGVVLAGWAWGRQGVAAARSAPPSWATVLARLDAARAEAFARGDAGLLAEVWAAGSPALRSDAATLEGLHRQGRTAEGLRHEVADVRVVTVSGDRVELDVRERLAAYVLRGTSGASPQAAGPTVRHRVVLVRGAAGWRLAQIRTD
jgi:hypothetical protein